LEKFLRKETEKLQRMAMKQLLLRAACR